MRHIFAAAIVIAASTAFALAGNQSGKPRYFVKAWLQKTDKSFEHTTGWCDDSYRCNPHTEVLYYRLADELADKDRVEFGTIYIALEDLR